MPRRRIDQTLSEVTKDDFESLRQKFQLLEGDRKAYFETYELTKKQNDTMVSELRGENQELRKAISELKRERSGARSFKDDAQELAQETSRLNRLRMEFDALHHRSQKLTETLGRAKDELRDLELDSRRPAQEDSPLTRKIRMLENRLDKAMIKYNEAQSIRKTYEQIVKRLGEERLAAIERTLGAKKHDFEELQLLSGDARHAKEIASQELERNTYRDKVSVRESELKDRESLVKQRETIEKKRQDLIAQASGDLSKKEEDNLKKALAVNSLQEGKIESEASAVKDKLDIYERAFRRIKEATGVRDINEVIQKIVSQEDTQQNLMELTKENQSKIESLQEEKARVKAIVEELKYAGPGGRSGARKLVDELEEKTSKIITKLERCKHKYERMQRTLIDGQAGIEHLAAKLSHLDVNGDGNNVKQQQMSDQTMVSILFNCESTLVEILNRIKLDRSKYGTAKGMKQTDTSFDEQDLQANRPFNRRINLPSGDGMDNGMNGFNLGNPLDNNEEVSREQMKSEALALVNSQVNRVKRPKKKKAAREQESLRRNGRSRGSGKRAGVV